MYYAIAIKAPSYVGSGKPYKITPELHEFESRNMRDRWVKEGNYRIKDSRQAITLREAKMHNYEKRAIRHYSL